MLFNLNKVNWERKKQYDKELRRFDKEIQNLENKISELEEKISRLDSIMCAPDQHPDIEINDDWYWQYGNKKEELQSLMERWEAKQIEKEEFEKSIKSQL